MLSGSVREDALLLGDEVVHLGTALQSEHLHTALQSEHLHLPLRKEGTHPEALLSYVKELG